jgi:hypothetical protein
MLLAAVLTTIENLAHNQNLRKYMIKEKNVQLIQHF